MRHLLVGAAPHSSAGKVIVVISASLVVGVEYPGAGIQRSALDQAGRAIRAALESEAT